MRETREMKLTAKDTFKLIVTTTKYKHGQIISN